MTFVRSANSLKYTLTNANKMHGIQEDEAISQEAHSTIIQFEWRFRERFKKYPEFRINFSGF